jgi:trigger factor
MLKFMIKELFVGYGFVIISHHKNRRNHTMNVKEIKNEGLNHTLEITVTANAIQILVDERLSEVAKTVSLPGFRPGKVPMNLLKKRYGQAVLGEVLEKAVNDNTAQLLKDRALRPATQPQVEILSFEEGKDLVFTIDIETLPKIELQDFKGLKLTKPVVPVTDAIITETLERIAEQNQDSEVITEKRPAAFGDITVIDFDGRKADGTEVAGMSGQGHSLKLGSNQFIPGFEDQLVGVHAGEKAQVKVTFPEQYHSEDLAGQDAIFDVTVHEIRAPKKAVLDDEFAKNLGLESFDALKDVIKQQIEGEYNQISRMKMKRELLDFLDSAYENVEVPARMVDQENAAIEAQLRREQNQAAGADVEIDEDERAELSAIAERRVRLGLVLAEIGIQNKIEVSNQDLQMAILRESQQYPNSQAQIFEFYRTNPQALEALRAPIFEEKVVDFIIELADITEEQTTIEALTHQEEESYLANKSEKKAAAPKAKAKKAAAADTDEAEKPAKKTTKKKDA